MQSYICTLYPLGERKEGFMRRKKIYRMTILAMFICLECVMMFTPLGYVPIGVVRATTLHIPVILAGMLLGKKEGLIIGSVFGMSSVLMNTLTPTITSFVFTPFYSLGEFSGNWSSLVIAMVPRMLLGYLSGWIVDTFVSKKHRTVFVYGSIALLMTLVHTILVLSGIYVFFGEAYAMAKGITFDALFGLLYSLVVTNGIIEAGLAAVVCSSVAVAVNKVRRI